MLADSQTWYLPKPWVEIRSHFDDDGPTGLFAATTYGPEYNAAVEALQAAETKSDLIIGIMHIGAHLLRFNYDLTNAELEELFVFRFDTPEETEKSMGMIEGIADIAFGRGKHNFIGTSVSP